VGSGLKPASPPIPLVIERARRLDRTAKRCTLLIVLGFHELILDAHRGRRARPAHFGAE